MKSATKLSLLSLAVVLAVLATPALADMTPDMLEGNWTGYCTQTSSTNAAGDTSMCTPKGVKVMFPIRFMYEFKTTGGTYSYENGAAKTGFMGKTYLYPAYKSKTMKVTSLPSIRPNTGCLGLDKTGPSFLVKVEGNVYTETGIYNMQNEATNVCPKGFKEPSCGKTSYTYVCTATKDA